MACPVLIDLRNVYSDEDMAQHGFLYVGVRRSDRKLGRTGQRLVELLRAAHWPH